MKLENFEKVGDIVDRIHQLKKKISDLSFLKTPNTLYITGDTFLKASIPRDIGLKMIELTLERYENQIKDLIDELETL